ncbi:hypothetical protein B9Z19DRAFT_1132075 [Tuber borchii]|uniref:Uncharacterized protein n=1 Tax=Tuber borchii TaxID=42251 RepID=A0A2T6ZHQ6_TUBBO|nr:hypothetical protein B9Z19DRAFT_1132075 [Tuber borchii]
MSTILDRSPLASYSFTTSQRIHIRVCYQDKLGNIKQTFYDQATGWKTRADPIVGKADLNNGLAITGWSNGTQERVYYIGKDNKILEVFHPELASTASYPNVNHRIFTPSRDNKLCVAEYDTSSWGQTKQLTDTISFSPAAATLVAGSTRIRAYSGMDPKIGKKVIS